jgi:diguanylate cyclase (GGDEF)-like protein
MSRRWLSVRQFCWIVAVFGGVALFANAGLGLGDEAPRRPVVLVLLGLGVLAGELLPLKIPRRGDDEELTISTTFSFALLVMSGAGAAVIVQAVASAVQDVISRKPLWRVAFNIGQYTLSLTAAALVLDVMADIPRVTGVAFTSADLPAMLLAALVFWVANTGIVGIAIALYQDVPLREYFRNDLGFSAATGSVLLCMAPILVAATEFSTALLPLFIFPLFAVYRGGRHAARSQYQATHDSLSELPNRVLFRDLISREVRSNGSKPFAVLLMDLDRFKDINDTLGHHYGDRVLAQIGPRLQSCLRSTDVLARLGGDEFGLLLPGFDPAQAEAVAARICEALVSPFQIDEYALEIAASIGIARFPLDGRDVDDLLRRADVAMYRAKDTNVRYGVYAPEHDDHSPERLPLVADLRRGIDNGELVLHYQPKVELHDRRVVGVEALVRWRHPTQGLLAPTAFIEIAEHAGLIKALTLRVLHDALGQCASWAADGIELGVAVNVSVRSLLDPRFPEQVAARLRETGVEPSRLTLELTESTLMADPDTAMAVLNRLGAMGVSLAIDDFGTGYSSLAYLKQLSVDELKIDRSFVMHLTQSRNDEVIVRSTVELAHNLDLRVVAEGVEDEDTLAQLRRFGCDQAQGFHLSRPLPAEQVPLWLTGSVAGRASRLVRVG